MIVTHRRQNLSQTFRSREQLAPAHEDQEFPYDVNQFKQIVALSARRSRVFIRSNFEINTDYKVIGKQHTMLLTRQCLAVAVAMQFKFSKTPHLIDQNYLPHYKDYQAEILAGVARKQSRRGSGRRKISPGQISFKFVGSTAIIVLPDLD